MRTRDTIGQRIGFDGSDKLKKELKEIGETGEKAFEQIERATHPLNNSLSRLSGIMGTVRAGAGSVAGALRPAADQFGTVLGNVDRLGRSLGNVADRVFPQFRTVLAVGLAASVAGFIGFTKSAADAADEMDDLAKSIGISVAALQKFQNIGLTAGIDPANMATALARFSKAVSEGAEEQQQALTNIGKGLMGELKASGDVVLRGTANTANAMMDMVVRGGRKMTDNIIDTGVGLSKATQTQLGEAASFLNAMLRDAGVKGVRSTQEIQAALQKISVSTTESARKMRDELRTLGVALPSDTIGEALDTLQGNLKTKLGQMGINLLKFGEDGKVVAKTVEEAFGDFADVVSKRGDITKVVLDNFGRGAMRLVSILKDGRAPMEDLAAEFTRLGFNISIADTVIGQKFSDTLIKTQTAIKNTRTILGLPFAEQLTPVFAQITETLAAGLPSLKAWADTMALRMKPAIDDAIAGIDQLGQVMLGADEKIVTSKTGQFFLSLRDQLSGIMPALEMFGRAVMSVANGVASFINALTGSNISGAGVLIVAVIAQLTGVFGLFVASVVLLTSLIPAMVAAFSALFAVLTAIAAVVGWPAVLAAGMIALAAVIIDWTALPGQLIDTWNAFWKMMGAFIEWAQTAAVAGLKSMFSGVANWFIGIANAVIKALNKIGEAKAALTGSAFNPIGEIQPFSKGGEVQGFAGGGSVRGRGSHWSDSILAALSDGEFVMQWAAVQKYGLGFMNALNSMRLPAIPSFAFGGSVGVRPSLAFANGGSVGGEGMHDRIAVDLTMPNGETFPDMLAPRTVAAKFGKFARRQSRVAIGRRPGWQH